MKEFECSKCHSKDVFISKSGNNTGLYCGDCGKWITWLNKDQLRLVERNRGEALKDVLQKLSEFSLDEIESACQKVGVHLRDEYGNFKNTATVLAELFETFK